MTSGGGVASERRPGNVDRENPWPGLAAFREADRQFFQGRDAETRDLVRLVERERVAVLLGRSGLGKTSLLHAGLFPILREQSYLPIYLRLDFSGEPDASALRRQVIEAVEDEARVREVEFPSPDGVDSLWEYFHRADSGFWGPKSRLLLPLLVFDQFEEIFTLGREPPVRAGSDAFVTELGDLAEGRLPARLRERLHADPERAAGYTFDRHHYKVLLSLREDFLPDLESLRDRLGPAIFNRLRLNPMSGTSALEVAGQAEHLISRDVAQEVVRFVAAGQPETSLHELVVDPALLSVVCRELNLKRRSRGIPRITTDLLEGTREEILEGFYERSVEGLPHRVRVFVEDELVTVSGFRDSVALDNALGAGVTRDEIAQLEDNRLVRVDARGGLQRLELSHDRLTSVVAERRDARRLLEAEDAKRRVRAKRRARIAGLSTLALVVGGAITTVYAKVQLDQRRLKTNGLIVAAVERLGGDGDPLLRALLLSELETGAASFGRTVSVAVELLGTAIPRVVFPVLDGGITAAAFTPAGDRILTGHATGTLRVWSVDGSTPLSVHEGHAGSVSSVSFGPDGSLLTSGDDGAALLWSPDLNRRDTLVWDAEFIYHASLSPDGLWALVSTEDSAVLSRTDGSASVPLIGQRHIVSAEFDPAGKGLITVTTDSAGGCAWLWDLGSASQPRELCGTDGAMHAAAFGNGGRVATASESGRVEVWDLTGASTSTELGRHGGSAWSIDFNRDRSRLVTASADSTAVVWDPTGGDEPFMLRGHSGRVVEAAFSPDGTRLLTVSDDGTARLWLAAAPSAARVLQGPDSAVTVQLSPDGARLISLSDDTVGSWKLDGLSDDGDADSGNHFKFPLPDSVRGRAWRALFSPDGVDIAVSTSDGAILLLPADGAGPGLSVAPARGPQKELAYGPRSDRILSWASDPSEPALIWQTRGAAEPVRLEGHTEQITHASFSPDGSRVVTASSDSTVRVWRTDGTGGEVRLRHDGIVRRAGFSPNGQWVVSASWDRTAGLAGTDGSEGGILLIGHARRVNSAHFNRDGSMIVTTSADGTARVWRKPWTDEPAVLRHTQPVTDGWFTPDGSYVVTAQSDGSVRIWDIDSERLLSRIRRATLACLSAADRSRYLGESATEADEGYKRCEERRGRGGPAAEGHRGGSP